MPSTVKTTWRVRLDHVSCRKFWLSKMLLTQALTALIAKTWLNGRVGFILALYSVLINEVVWLLLRSDTTNHMELLATMTEKKEKKELHKSFHNAQPCPHPSPFSYSSKSNHSEIVRRYNKHLIQNLILFKENIETQRNCMTCTSSYSFPSFPFHSYKRQ